MALLPHQRVACIAEPRAIGDTSDNVAPVSREPEALKLAVRSAASAAVRVGLRRRANRRYRDPRQTGDTPTKVAIGLFQVDSVRAIERPNSLRYATAKKA